MTNEDHKTFIVTLKESCSPDKFKESIKGLGGEIQHEYSLIKGYSIKLPSIHAASLHKNEGINTIEEDQEVKANNV